MSRNGVSSDALSIVTTTDNTSLVLDNLEIDDTKGACSSEPTPSISAILATGEVSVYSRLNNVKTVVRPSLYVDSLRNKLSRYSQDFSQATVRKEFMIDSLKVLTESKFAELSFTNHKVSVSDQIASSCYKGTRKVRFLTRSFHVPLVKSTALELVSSYLSVYIHRLFEEVDTVLSVQKISCRRSNTIDRIFSMLEFPMRSFSQTDSRLKVGKLFIVAFILEIILEEKQEDFNKFLSTTPIIENPDGLGSFIRLDSINETSTDRLQSMALDSCVAIPLHVVYNLSYRNMSHLIHFIFDKDLETRVESKISLLSSLRLDVRNDVILSPEKVLLTSLKEHLLTRTEIISLFFHHKTNDYKTYRCMSCTLNVTFNGTSLNHICCPVTDWLVKNLQFEYSGNSLIIPPLALLAPSVASYATQLLEFENKRIQATYTCDTSTEYTLTKMDQHGVPRQVSRVGIKPVTIHNSPSCASMHPTKK